MNFQQSKDNPLWSNNYISALDTDTLLDMLNKYESQTNIYNWDRDTRNEKLIEDIKLELSKRNNEERESKKIKDEVASLALNYESLDSRWERLDNTWVKHLLEEQSRIADEMLVISKKLAELWFDVHWELLKSKDVTKEVQQKVMTQLELPLSGTK